jgi:hypothetical protein
MTADNIVCTNAATFGGGYGATGATISTAGVGQFNGAVTVDGLLTVNGITMDTSVFVLTDTTGVISWVPTTTTGDAATFDGTTVTSGTILKMIAVDATLANGYYLELLGGTNSTVVWTVGEGGATRITPNVNTIEPLYIDAILTSTADALTIRMDDDVQNGGLFVECLGGASYDTSQFSVGEGGAVYILGATTQVGEWQAGGGYGSTGVTVSTAGVIQANGAITTDGALTADSAAIGGGYGSTGASLSNAGVGQFNGALTTDGLLTANGGIAVDSTAFTVANTSGNVVTAGTLDVQGGDITLQNDEYISNSSDGTVEVRTGVIRHSFDAAAYYDITVADGAGVTLDVTSDGTADLTISDNVNLSAALDVQGGDITLQNDETISNSSDGYINTAGILNPVGRERNRDGGEVGPVVHRDVEQRYDDLHHACARIGHGWLCLVLPPD